MRVLMTNTNSVSIFRKSEFFNNLDNYQDNYQVLLSTEEGDLNISETTDVPPESKEEFLAFIKKAIQTASVIYGADNGEENLRHWIAASNDQGFLYDSDFPKRHTHFEIRSLQDWAQDELVNLGYVTDDGLRILMGHTNFEAVAEELLENSEYEHTELSNGNILMYTY